MQPLYVLAVPKYPPEAQRWIDAVRARHDPLATRIAPQVTLVFGQTVLAQAALIEHLMGVGEDVSPFDLVCRRVVVGTDHTGPAGYAFLVPDSGNAALHALRDRLHGGPLAPARDLSIPFVPHITLGRFDSPQQAARVCDMLNRRLPELRGRVEALRAVAQGREGSITALDTGRFT